MSRRRNFSDDQIEAALRKCAGIQTDAAHALEEASGIKCSRQLVSHAVKRSARLREACDEALEEVLDLGESRLFAAVKVGEISAVKFLLETRGKARGYSRRTELTGPKGNAMEMTGSVSLAGSTSAEVKGARQRNLDLIEAVSKRLANGAHEEAGSDIEMSPSDEPVKSTQTGYQRLSTRN